MYIRETFVNETKGYQLGESDWYAVDANSLGELFRRLRQEYGGSVTKMYVDRADKPPVQTGWVFRRRMEYEDARPGDRGQNRFYMREVWVSVSMTEPKRETRILNVRSPWDSVSGDAPVASVT